jgi:O-antigen ligase
VLSPESFFASVKASLTAEQTSVQWLLGIVLVFAPLFRSGQPALAIMVLELLAVALLMLVLWQDKSSPVTRAEGAALILIVAVPLLYLVPLPAFVAEWVPARSDYLEAQSLMSGVAPGWFLSLSLYPQETGAAFLLLLVPVAVFLAARTLHPHRLYRLVLLLLGIATAQALIGLLQFGASAGSPELLGVSLVSGQGGTGTYTNRNHLAGLLAMTLPIAMALTVFYVGRRQSGRFDGFHERIAFIASARGHTAILYGGIAVLLLVGVIFTRSRAGIALAMLGVLLSTVLLARRIGGDNVYGTTGTIAAVAVGIGIFIGLAPVLDRFSTEGAIEDARWTIFSSTLDGIGAFSPLGSGPGSHPDVFPAFQPLELGRWFINHAHNDYLEWLFEAGLVAAALIVFLLFLFAWQWGKVWTKGVWPRSRFVQVGAGIGILLLLLHSLVDYNLHMPANLAYFAFLVGVFFAPPEAMADLGPRRRKPRRTPSLDEVESPLALPEETDRPAPPPNQIKNPLLD